MAEAALTVRSARADGPVRGVVIVLNAHVDDAAFDGRDDMFLDLGMVKDFVSRSNGRLRAGRPSRSGFAVEILLPRGEALLA